MQLLLMVGEAIGLVIGSMTAAALLCWFLWSVSRLVLHPEWVALAVLILSVIALFGDLPKSQFLDMTLTFAAVAALPLWFAGRAWRQQRRQGLEDRLEQGANVQPSKSTAPTRAEFSPRLYPAITACICEARAPTRSEVHIVAARLWREGIAQRFGSQTGPASFAARRVLLRAATAALSGRNGERGPGRSALG